MNKLDYDEPEPLEEELLLLIERDEGGHLTSTQAMETVELFPSIEEASKVVEAYFSIPKDEREILYGNYDTFLETLRKGKLGSEEKPSLYETEVAERTTIVPEDRRSRERYRDTPQRSGHYWEHIASQEI